MSSVAGNRKPQVAIYRPGSGPLKKTGPYDEEYEKVPTQSDGMSKGKREDSGRGRSDVYKLSDDFDRLSVSSNRSGKDSWKASRSLSGSTGNLIDRRRSRKPEAALYMPPKPSIETPSTNQENKTYKSRNYSNSHRNEPCRREDSFRRDIDQVKNDSEPFRREDSYRRPGNRDRDSVVRDDDNARKFRGKDTSSQFTDKSRDVRGESEPPSQKPNDRQRKTFRKKSRRRNGKIDKRDENLISVNGKKGEKITPLMDIKFDYNPLTGERKDSINYDMMSYETSGHTTTDGENEKDPLCSLRNTISQPNRNLRQVSEPRSLSLNSVQTENRGRDTRSVEPGEDNSWSQDRFNQKPPAGLYGKRSNSKVTHPKHKQHHMSFDQLPPRLQKKYMEENGLQELPSQCPYPTTSSEKSYYGSNPDCATDSEASFASPAPQQSYLMTNTKPSYLGMNTTFIGTNSEDPWDGSSVTFQGTHPNTFYTNVPPPLPNIFSRPPPPLPQMTPSIWSQTLPPARARGRGRGRVPQHELERDKITFDELRMTRSLTPDAVRELEGPVSLPPEPFHQTQEECKGAQNNQNNAVSVLPKSHVSEDRSLEKDTQKEPQRHSSDDNTASKQRSPVMPKSSQDLTFKKPSVTGMVSV